MAYRVVINDHVQINDTFTGDPTMIGKTGHVKLILMPENYPGVLLEQDPYDIVLAHHEELDILNDGMSADGTSTA